MKQIAGFLLAFLMAVPFAMSDEKAVFGGGCFWCMEAIFQTRPGVKSVVSGYAGGRTANPTYEEVCTGGTGHAEAVEITFDPDVISYNALLDLFWDAHDPTTLNRQGADSGTQYRSIIVAQSPEQLAAAKKSRSAAASKFRSPVVTEIVEGAKFYPAEAKHQNFYRRNPDYPYNRAVIAPKLEKLKKPDQTSGK